MNTAFNEYFAAVRPVIVADLLARLHGLACDLPPTVAEPLVQSASGGKCLRGCLLFLVNEAFAGDQTTARPRATAIEAIHAASLVHDDLIDQDTERRLRPAAWFVLGARSAVLLGDVILADSLKLLAECGRDDARVGAGAIADMARGAYLEQRDGNDDDYERVIQLKTGILFAASAELGAIAAGVAASDRDNAREFGALLGQAYQMADDLQELESHATLSAGGLAALRHFAPKMAQTSGDNENIVVPQLSQRDALAERLFIAARSRAHMALSAARRMQTGVYRHLLCQAIPGTLGQQHRRLGEVLGNDL